jgi:hypothetical protein
MAEIIEALEGSIVPIECISLGPDGSLVCSRESEREHVCPTKLLWTRVRSSIVRTLMETTLESLVAAPPPSISVSELERAALSEAAPDGAFDGAGMDGAGMDGAGTDDAGTRTRAASRGSSKRRRALATGA